MKYKSFTALHSGGLVDCIKTETPISYFTAQQLIKSGIYEFYGYDSRIKAHRYILKDMKHDLGLPTWLHIRLEND